MGERGYLGGQMLLDIDAVKLSTARVYSDVTLGKMWDLGAEYLKADPSLLLSHQSVLSVFGTSAYQEVGATLGLRPVPMLRLDGSGYVQFYQGTGPGTRLGFSGRLASSSGPDATILTVGYGRVDAVDLGYHSVRVALSEPIGRAVTATLQGFAYFYDRAIEGYKTSTTGSLAVSYDFAPNWELLWAGLASRSPYAAVDASTQLRLTYQFSLSDRGPSW